MELIQFRQRNDMGVMEVGWTWIQWAFKSSVTNIIHGYLTCKDNQSVHKVQQRETKGKREYDTGDFVVVVVILIDTVGFI